MVSSIKLVRVPGGDYGIVQILFLATRKGWEVGCLLNYGLCGGPVGMQKPDREVIPECREVWG